jgi:high-affinity nickel-transport protein
VGALHGLAGSAAVALAVLTQVEGVVEGLGYLVAFGAGTVLGMMVATGLIGVPLSLRVANERLHQMRQRWLRPVAGLASVVVGAVMVGKIGFVDGLFVP